MEIVTVVCPRVQHYNELRLVNRRARKEIRSTVPSAYVLARYLLRTIALTSDVIPG